MESFQTLAILFFFAVILVNLAQKLRIPYPIALVLGGAAIGLIPGLPVISFDPNLILMIVLPPILYYAAFGTAFREFKKNWKEIFSLALGLVVITTLIIGLIFKWLFPQFPWALAFAFGAIVSPPDSVAATAILKRFSINPRLLSVLEGESLINDASALVLYRLSVAALFSGVFSFSEASFEFSKIVFGGTALGFFSGILLQNFSKRFLEPVVGVIFSFTIPYVTYILADYLGVSGVLAVVVNGLIGARILAKHHSSLRRVVGFAFWDIFIILMNCFVFILIGLQLSNFVSTMEPKQVAILTAYAFFITLIMMAIRFVWVYSTRGIAYVRALMKPKLQHLCPQILREATIIGWSGMRGIVSIIAALALPYTLQNGQTMPGRDEVILMTFIVVLITLILPSSTLAYLIGFMKLHHHQDHAIVHKARKQLAEVADANLRHLKETGDLADNEHDFLANYFKLQRYVREISSSEIKKLSDLESARVKIFQAQRNALVDLWENEAIDDKLFLQLEHELDIEESLISRAELK